MKITDSKGVFPMLAGEMVEFIETVSKNFRQSYMNEVNLLVDQKVLDAIIVDFVNYIALSQCIDLALYIEDLQKPDQNAEHNWVLDCGLIKRIIITKSSQYKKNGICKSVMRNCHMNDIAKPFEEKDAQIIVDDMVVYIFEQL